jgi:hypothetical protein
VVYFDENNVNLSAAISKAFGSLSQAPFPPFQLSKVGFTGSVGTNHFK